MRNPVARWLAATLLCCAFTLTASSGQGAQIDERAWWLFESSHFQVYSDLPPKQIQATITSLEAFRGAVAQLTGTDPPQLHETRLVLFKRLQDFRRLEPRKGVLGFMTAGLRYNLMVAVRPPRGAILHSDTAIIFHEYVHQLIRSASGFRYPPWYDEGFAELLSTARVSSSKRADGRTQLRVGFPTTVATNVFDRGTGMPLPEVLRYQEQPSNTQQQREGFYAKAWLFTHYLLFSAEGQRRQLPEASRRYLRAYDRGQLEERTFEETFGMSETAMDAVLAQYRPRTATIPLIDPPLPAQALHSKRLSQDHVRYELGHLMLARTPDLGLALLNRIAPGSPHYPRAQSALAQFDVRHHRFAAALAKQQTAISDAPEDPLLQIGLAETLLKQCAAATEHNGCRDLGVRQEALAHYRRAYELAPELAETQVRYGQALMRDGLAQQALPILQSASARLPGNYQLTVDLGLAHWQVRQWEAAEFFLQRALGWSVDEPNEHNRITSLLELLDSSRSAEAAARYRQEPAFDEPEEQ